MLESLQDRQARITHAAGAYALLLAEIRAPSRVSPAASPVSTPDGRPQVRSNPLQRNLLAARQSGAIPEPLVGTLLLFADETANPVRRSEAAHRAGRSLMSLEEQAHPGRLHRSQEKAMRTHVSHARDALAAVQARIDDLLARMYREPRAARAVLDKITQRFSGPGELTRALSEKPEGLGSLRGSVLVFRVSEERSRAQALLPELITAVERAGRCDQTLHDRRAACRS